MDASARMLYSYKYAEENNLMVVGAANRTECTVGLFAKFGVDDAADLMPLKNLYRSEVLQLAKHLALPAEICERTPNPDMVPGVTDKYRSYLGISAAELDLILKGFDKRSKSSRIAKELGIDEQLVLRIEQIVELTKLQRTHSLCPLDSNTDLLY